MIRTLSWSLVALSVALAVPAGAETEPKPKAKKSSKETPASPLKKEFDVSRANLVYAARSCSEQPARCDEDLLHNSESRFLKACNACTGMEDCRDEAKAILAGGSGKGLAPCK